MLSFREAFELFQKIQSVISETNFFKSGFKLNIIKWSAKIGKAFGECEIPKFWNVHSPTSSKTAFEKKVGYVCKVHR